MAYYLMDVEFSLVTGMPCYLKKNQDAYTSDVKSAGLFSKEVAEKILKNDLGHRTAKFHINTIAEMYQWKPEKV